MIRRTLLVLTAATVAFAVAGEDALAVPWCGPTTTQDRAPVFTGRSIRVVYAYASDGADRSAELASRISADVDAIGDWWRGQDPSREPRFDRVTFVDMPHDDAREAYIKAKAPDVDEVTRARWVKATKGLSIAHLRELIVATQALGDDDEDTIKRLLKMQEDFLDSQKPPEFDAFGQETLAAMKGGRGLGGIGFQRR